ncbi:TRAP transporter substrate-binding protein DctP [Dechloromonas sp. ZY10]|uniref:TRAP transporter substrate-binding protein n=1 Tax=Dechloromonas aquae TaxID=2664436 RepID=UPI0035298B7D
MLRKLWPLLICACLALGNGAAGAADKQLRIGTLAPKNSLYHRQLLEVGEAWRAAQGGSGKYLVYPDGSQGGETDMARRMRIGQLQGALLSVVGLREIEPSIAALQALPLLFRSWEEVDYVREKMRAGMEQKFLDKGFVVLAWGDAGWVRFFSKEAALRPDDYQRMKFFAWAGENEQQAIMKSLGYTPVPLETSDILPAIQTGMINAVPSTPYFALATQIYTSAPHMLDINWAPIVGALVITKKAWDESSPEAQAALRSAGAKAGMQMRAKARQEVDEAVAAMKKRGLTVNTPNPAQMQEWQALAEKLYPRIRGKMVPAETFDEVMGHLKDFRSGKAK